MKILKYALYTVVGLIVLVLLAVAVVVATFDPNKYKGELARVVKEKTGRTLAVEGKIGLSARRRCPSATATRSSRASTTSKCPWRCCRFSPSRSWSIG
jgi:uncharacterized protein involved in outer membrane biogenesis